MNPRQPEPHRTARKFRTVMVLALCAAAATGCDALDSLLGVEAPGQVIADDLNDPQHAELLVRSVVTDFECAFGGYILASGVHGDIFADAQLTEGNYWVVDKRQTGRDGGLLAAATCGSNAFPGIYTTLQTARFQGDDVAALLEGWTDAQMPNRDSLLATAYAYAGYAVLLLAESYCSIAIDVGPELTRAEAFEEAEARFTKAIAAARASGNTSIENMALVGRARARLNLAIQDGTLVDAQRLGEARVDAELVAQDFVRLATFDAAPTRRRNNVYNANSFLGFFTVESDYRNLEFQGEPDPRVDIDDTGGMGSDNITSLYVQTKYSSFGAPIPIASWDEAQLIIAEAAARIADPQDAVSIITMFHLRAGLDAYTGGTDLEITQHVIQERSRELFLEGQHLGDKLRYGLDFTPAPGTPYPPKAGGVYGDTRCLPLPLVEERNNPNI